MGHLIKEMQTTVISLSVPCSSEIKLVEEGEQGGPGPTKQVINLMLLYSCEIESHASLHNWIKSLSACVCKVAESE